VAAVIAIVDKVVMITLEVATTETAEHPHTHTRLVVGFLALDRNEEKNEIGFRISSVSDRDHERNLLTVVCSSKKKKK